MLYLNESAQNVRMLIPGWRLRLLAEACGSVLLVGVELAHIQARFRRESGFFVAQKAVLLEKNVFGYTKKGQVLSELRTLETNIKCWPLLAQAFPLLGRLH